MDHVYHILLDYLSVGGSKEGNRTHPKKGGGKRAYRRYLYPRAQDLYNKNPDLLARRVRTDMVSFDDRPAQLEEPSIRDLYTKLWETKSAVQAPRWGESEQTIPLDDIGCGAAGNGMEDEPYYPPFKGG